MAKNSIIVTATANGYYGSKVRVPGERFALNDAKDFSEVWMTKDKPEKAERFVGTGGTDGVVGTTVQVDDPSDRTAKQRKEMADLGISENDDRTRDRASSTAMDAPLPEPADEDPKSKR